MASDEHVALLKEGVTAWNAWRNENPNIRPNLSSTNLSGANLGEANLSGADLTEAYLDQAHLDGADLSRANLAEADLSQAHLGRADLRRANLLRAFLVGADLGKANLRWADLGRARLAEANLSGADLTQAYLDQAHLDGADLRGANLRGADLRRASLREAILFQANLRGAHLDGANLFQTNLSDANLRGATLHEANLRRADLKRTDLSRADLRSAILVSADLTCADLTGCRIHGVSAWDLKPPESDKQHNLIITKEGEPEVTTDDIEVAQFLYLLMHNQKIRRIIDTITSKVVLILGRFTPVRKPMLDALRDELRKPERGYVPVVFDFEPSRSQTTIETVTLLARMARFVIADLSDAKSVLQELQAIVPTSPKLAVQPVIISTQDEPGMFDFIESFHWVAKTYRYDDLAQLTANLDKQVIRPAEAKVSELRGP